MLNEIESDFTPEELEYAIYLHLVALRTLGITNVNTIDIANALDLTVEEVDSVLPRLKLRGVKY